MMTTEILALTPEQLEVSPGVGAFTTFFVLAVAMALLVLNMSKHLRKVDRYRIEEEVRAEFEAEQAAKAEAAAQAETDEAAELGDAPDAEQPPASDEDPS